MHIHTNTAHMRAHTHTHKEADRRRHTHVRQRMQSFTVVPDKSCPREATSARIWLPKHHMSVFAFQHITHIHTHTQTHTLKYTPKKQNYKITTTKKFVQFHILLSDFFLSDIFSSLFLLKVLQSDVKQPKFYSHTPHSLYIHYQRQQYTHSSFV